MDNVHSRVVWRDCFVTTSCVFCGKPAAPAWLLRGGSWFFGLNPPCLKDANNVENLFSLSSHHTLGLEKAKTVLMTALSVEDESFARVIGWRKRKESFWLARFPFLKSCCLKSRHLDFRQPHCKSEPMAASLLKKLQWLLRLRWAILSPC